MPHWLRTAQRLRARGLQRLLRTLVPVRLRRPRLHRAPSDGEGARLAGRVAHEHAISRADLLEVLGGAVREQLLAQCT